MPLIPYPGIAQFADGETSPDVIVHWNEVVDAVHDLALASGYVASLKLSGETALTGDMIVDAGDGITITQNDGLKTLTFASNVYVAGESIRDVVFAGDGYLDVACDDLKRVDAYAAAINFEPDLSVAGLAYIPAGSYAYTPYSEGVPYDLRPTLWADSAVNVSGTWYVRIQYRNLWGNGVLWWWALAY